jgi:predicted ATP-dependent endonuclease of OLD family
MTLHELQNVINVDVISTFDNSLKQSDAVKKLSDDNVETELDWEIYQLQKKYLDYQLNISKRKDIIIEENSEHIKDKLEKIKYPQVRFLEIIDDLFLETCKKINRNENQIEFLIGNKSIPPFKLSSGEKQLLIILLTVLVQDNRPTILFMDEPEISLHIDWQRKLIKYIRELNPNVQIILATHSPDIIMDGWMDKVFNISDIIVKDNAAV